MMASVRMAGVTRREEYAEATRQAMSDGHDIIFQAALLSGSLFGRADFLRRVDRPSGLGAWSYEVIDTKLGRSPKAKLKRLA